MDFKSDVLSKNLAERIKELECLYNISRIATTKKYDLEAAIDLILKEIPKGWQYPEVMAACLIFGDQQRGEMPKHNNYQSVFMPITEGLKGELFVYFNNPSDSTIHPHFLLEEQYLLNQIGREVASLIELDIQRNKERIIQEKLKANDRLNLLGELTAGIAHELNTPLGNVLGYTEMLLKTESDVQKKSDLEKVIKSAKHAREIVKKLMIFSCDMPSQFKKGDLNKLIGDCIDLINIQLNEKKILVNQNLQDSLPLIRMDNIQFTQVIFNMLLNAIDAMDQNGTMTISTQAVEKDIRLRISDNGKGIASDELKNLFQPFYTKNKESGVGLGLAVSHGIVRAHGGRIEVESEEGKGTTFTIILKSE